MRVGMGLTQKELGGDCGVSERTIGLIETDPGHRLRRRTFEALLIALEVDDESVLLRRDPPLLYDGTADDLDESDDHLMSWPSPLYGFVRRAIGPGERTFCTDVEDAREAAAEMRRGWGEHLGRFADPTHRKDLFDADCRLNEDIENYARRYVDIWRVNPDCILYSCVGEDRTGLSFVLPVTDEAYRSMRDGERHFMQITADDILPRSQNLILDSLVEIPGRTQPGWHQMTSSLSFTLFFQLAMLSVDPVDPAFRMLGFGASPMNAKRLESVAFSRVGTRMPTFKFPLYEFGLDPMRRQDDATSRAVVSAYLARVLRSKLGDRSGGFKQQVIRRALRAYQPIARRHAAVRHRSAA